MILKKIITLPPRFDPRLAAIKEAKDLNKLTMDEIHESITAEMICDNGKSSRRKASFKASKKQEALKSDDNSD